MYDMHTYTYILLCIWKPNLGHFLLIAPLGGQARPQLESRPRLGPSSSPGSNAPGVYFHPVCLDHRASSALAPRPRSHQSNMQAISASLSPERKRTGNFGPQGPGPKPPCSHQSTIAQAISTPLYN